jgi:chromosomal replication initiator protein
VSGQSTQSIAPVSFLLLDENRFAQTAIRQALRTSATGRQPWIYLFGPSGVGKTLLIQRFLREALQAESNLRFVHTTAGEFAAQFAEASEAQSIPELLERYLHLDLLICEDLQALENRAESQRFLLSILDQLWRAGNRIVLSCRKSPGELVNVQKRLLNRCRAGVCAKITLPEKPSRLLLINHFAQSHQIAIPTAAAKHLAEELPVSPRELHATVLQLEATGQIERAPLNLAYVRSFLKREVKPPGLTLPQIARVVAHQFGVRVSDIRARNRLQGLVVPRQCAMYLARELTNERFRLIADYFGKRNHSTVVHACTRFREILPDDPALRQHVQQIKHQLAVNDVGPASNIEE